MTLQNFTITPLSASVGCSNGFPSAGAQHVTRNPTSGTFYITELAPAQVSAGYPNSFQLLRDSGNGAGPVLAWSSGPINTNMCCVESLATGEVYVIYCDFVNGYLYVVYWAAGTNWVTNTTPTTTLQITSAGLSGKIGAVMDEGRRQLFVVVNAGTVFRVSETATLLGRQLLFTSVTDAPQYVAPHIDSNGMLGVVLCSDLSGSDYDFNAFALCVNPNDIGGVSGQDGVWTAGPWYNGAPQLSLPVDPGYNGPLLPLNWGEQYRSVSSLLVASNMRQGRLRLAMLQGVSGSNFWTRDDMGSVCIETMVSKLQPAPNMLINANFQKPLRDNLTFARGGSAGWAIRTPGDFLVVTDRNTLICYKSIDFGKSWQTYAQTPIPSIGTDTPHYVTISRGLYSDTDIIGMFTVEHCTPTQWSTSTAPVPPAYAANNPTASAFYFTLPVT